MYSGSDAMDNEWKAHGLVALYYVIGFTIGLMLYFGILGVLDHYGIVPVEDWNEWFLLISFMVFPQMTAWLCALCNIDWIRKRYPKVKR